MDLGQQLHDLCIGKLKYNAQLVTALPTLFPRFRFLRLESGYVEVDKIDTHALKAMATNWKNVENNVDSSSITNVIIWLLQALTFDRLTSLELICKKSPAKSQRLQRAQVLIKDIHNAPSLEILARRYPIVKIADMEKLHA